MSYDPGTAAAWLLLPGSAGRQVWAVVLRPLGGRNGTYCFERTYIAALGYMLVCIVGIVWVSSGTLGV